MRLGKRLDYLDLDAQMRQLFVLYLFIPFLSSATVRRYPDSKDKVKALYIRIVSPFPEMEQFLQDTMKR